MWFPWYIVLEAVGVLVFTAVLLLHVDQITLSVKGFDLQEKEIIRFNVMELGDQICYMFSILGF